MEWLCITVAVSLRLVASCRETVWLAAAVALHLGLVHHVPLSEGCMYLTPCQYHHSLEASRLILPMVDAKFKCATV